MQLNPRFRLRRPTRFQTKKNAANVTITTPEHVELKRAAAQREKPLETGCWIAFMFPANTNVIY